MKVYDEGMKVYDDRERRGNCKTLRDACGVRATTFSGLQFFSRIFVLLDLSNVEMDGGV